MSYRIRQIDLDDKMCHQVNCALLSQVYAPEALAEQLGRYGVWEKRERRLNMPLLIHVLIAAGLWTDLALPRVLKRLGWPLHLSGLDLEDLRVSGGAICYRREQLGWEPLRGLFEQCCHPLCTQETPGAFRFGYRLVALDGTVQDVADTEANAAQFARPSNQYGEGPFPQARLLLLMECGSHAPFGAAFTSSAEVERTVAYELLERIEADMLVLHDAQFPGLPFWQAIREKGAHVLSQLPSHHLLTYQQQLSDGSYLAAYTPHAGAAQRALAPLLVRVIEYRITDERLGEPGKVYRLATTLLNPRVAPACELIECYHERWEVEIVLDEIKTHQRLQEPVLRSRTPEGVRQEIYAVLLAHYLIRKLMLDAAGQAGLPPLRLSFTEAVFVLGEVNRDLTVIQVQQRERLVQEALLHLAAKPLPERRLRMNPRVLKKLYRKYKRKHRHLPPPRPFEPQQRFLDFVVLLI